LIERDEVIRASLVLLLSRQRLFVLGPPDTGKSALVTSFSERICPQNGAGLRSLAYLMTRFITPEELFGLVPVSGLKRDEYRAARAQRWLGACLNLTLLVTFNLVAHQSSAKSFGNVILICF